MRRYLNLSRCRICDGGDTGFPGRMYIKPHMVMEHRRPPTLQWVSIVMSTADWQPIDISICINAKFFIYRGNKNKLCSSPATSLCKPFSKLISVISTYIKLLAFWWHWSPLPSNVFERSPVSVGISGVYLSRKMKLEPIREGVSFCKSKPGTSA